MGSHSRAELVRFVSLWALVACSARVVEGRACGQMPSQQSLQRSIRTGIENRTLNYKKPEIVERVDKNGQAEMVVYLGGLGTLIAPSEKVTQFSLVLHHPARLQATVETLRLFGGDAAMKRMWEPSLRRVEAVIADQLESIRRADKLDETLTASLEKADDDAESILKQAAADIGRRLGKKGYVQYKYEAVVFTVGFAFPPGVAPSVKKVSYCPEIYFIIAGQGNPPDSEWVDVANPNDTINLGGMLRFRAIVAGRPNTIMKVLVDKDVTVQFRP